MLGLVKVMTAFTRKGALAGIGDLEAGQANTAAVFLPDGRLWALHEASLPFEFAMTEEGGISSVGFTSMDKRLDFSVSAHPKVDFQKGEVIFHGYGNSGGKDG